MYQVIFNSGFVGLLIWVLLFASSTAGLAIAIRCVWSLRRGAFASRAFPEKLLPPLKSGDWQGAFDYCAAHKTLAAAAVNKVLLSAHASGKTERQELVSEMLDRRVKAILRLINSLSMCGNIAPMLGLLGTVTGMVDAFLGLGTAMGPEKASVLAVSISQALYTTAAGLLVAIPAIACTVFFRNMLEKRVELVTDLLEQALPLIAAPDSSAPAEKAR